MALPVAARREERTSTRPIAFGALARCRFEIKRAFVAELAPFRTANTHDQKRKLGETLPTKVTRWLNRGVVEVVQPAGCESHTPAGCVRVLSPRPGPAPCLVFCRPTSR